MNMNTPESRSELRAERGEPQSRPEPQPRPEPRLESRPELAAGQPQALDALFPADIAAQYRTEWAHVQSSFVDDPQRAVTQGDELVNEVMKSLADTFAQERERLDRDLSETGEASTEALRLGLRRYRSFFERLLSL